MEGGISSASVVGLHERLSNMQASNASFERLRFVPTMT